jgi:hypothetical protein
VRPRCYREEQGSSGGGSGGGWRSLLEGNTSGHSDRVPRAVKLNPSPRLANSRLTPSASARSMKRITSRGPPRQNLSVEDFLTMIPTTVVSRGVVLRVALLMVIYGALLLLLASPAGAG